ncbi:hypothetical protein QY888_08465 [Latilactobacillus sakei]
MAKRTQNWRWVDWVYVFTIASHLLYIGIALEEMLNYPDQNAGLAFTMVQVVGGLVIATLPIILERFMRYRFPEILYAVYLVFIYCSILLGTGLHFYSQIYYWDKFLHILSARFVGRLRLYDFFSLDFESFTPNYFTIIDEYLCRNIRQYNWCFLGILRVHR